MSDFSDHIWSIGDNVTNYPKDKCIHQLLEEQTERSPEALAITYGDHGLTYQELNGRANQLAHHLRKLGVGPDVLVGICMERSPTMVIGILGTLKAGGAYLPISPEDPPDRIRFILEDAQVKTLLVHEKTETKAPFGVKLVNLEKGELFAGSPENPQAVNKPDDLAYVIYTSGSTGRPKGVMIEHRSVVNRLHWMQCAYPIDSRDVILQKTNYCFDVSVWELFWWGLQGAQLHLLVPGGERMPLAIVEAVRKHRVSVMHFVPSMLNVFLEYLDGKNESVLQRLESVRQIFVSGESLTPSHVRRFNKSLGRKVGTRLTNLYGPTEATVDVTYFDCPTNDGFGTIPIGRPIYNTRIYILKDRNPAAVGESGELCIAGIGLARGYLNNPDLTRQKFVDNPCKPGERIYRTGDMARWLPDGNIEYLGREDSQVKIRGLRIELGEIENTIRAYPGIRDCIAVARKYSESIILIIAYIVCASDFDVPGLKGHLKKHLPEYMVPHHFERIDQIPLSPNGKADRKALPEPVLLGKIS